MIKGENMKIAVASSDGENVDLHFGKGRSLYVYDYNEENGDLSFLEHRTVRIEEDKKEQSYLIINAIKDCDVAICLEFGFKAQIKANDANIKLVREEGTVKDALDSYINHVNFMKNVKI